MAIEALFVSLVTACAAVFWAFFFEPIQHTKDMVFNGLISLTKSPVIVALTPLFYCPRCCGNIFGLAIAMYLGYPLHMVIAVALLSSVMAHLLSLKLRQEDVH